MYSYIRHPVCIKENSYKYKVTYKHCTIYTAVLLLNRNWGILLKIDYTGISLGVLNTTAHLKYREVIHRDSEKPHFHCAELKVLVWSEQFWEPKCCRIIIIMYCYLTVGSECPLLWAAYLEHYDTNRIAQSQSNSEGPVMWLSAGKRNKQKSKRNFL